jgi:hypothetical protein
MSDLGDKLIAIAGAMEKFGSLNRLGGYLAELGEKFLVDDLMWVGFAGEL